jgi:hypothetical protein
MTNYKTGFKSNIIIKSEEHYEKTQRTGFPSRHMLCLLPGEVQEHTKLWSRLKFLSPRTSLLLLIRFVLV